MQAPSPLIQVSADESHLAPTTNQITQDCPRFRILIVGRSGVGKSSLINAIFRASLADVKHDRAGAADINQEITSNYNKHFVVHDSQGYEPGDEKKFNILKKFITERSRKKLVADRIHAIWLCITVPYASARIFERGDEKIFKLNRDKVPVIVVFTKYDLLITSATAQLRRNGINEDRYQGMCEEMAERTFKETCVGPFLELTTDIATGIPYVPVAISQPDTLQQLVEITMRNVRVDVSIPQTRSFLSWRTDRLFSNNTREDQYQAIEKDVLDSAQVAFVTAQRVDMQAKIDASISVGRKKYWKGIGSGVYFQGLSLVTCLNALHKDIVRVWNVQGLEEYLLSETFFRRMTLIVQDLSDLQQQDTVESAMATASDTVGVGVISRVIMVAAWAYGVYKRSPENIRCLMGYVVDLALIMQALFRASLEDQGGIVAQGRVEEIIEKFDESGKKTEIHDVIRNYVATRHAFARDSAMDTMEMLITKNKELCIELCNREQTIRTGDTSWTSRNDEFSRLLSTFDIRRIHLPFFGSPTM